MRQAGTRAARRAAGDGLVLNESERWCSGAAPDPNHRWGAIARNGQPLANPVHPSRKTVIDELEQLLADTRLVL